MTVPQFIVVRGIVKAILSIMLIGSTCIGVLFFPDAINGGGMALLGGLTGAVITHYFQPDTDDTKVPTKPSTKADNETVQFEVDSRE